MKRSIVKSRWGWRIQKWDGSGLGNLTEQKNRNWIKIERLWKGKKKNDCGIMRRTNLGIKEEIKFWNLVITNSVHLGQFNNLLTMQRSWYWKGPAGLETDPWMEKTKENSCPQDYFSPFLSELLFLLAWSSISREPQGKWSDNAFVKS